MHIETFFDIYYFFFFSLQDVFAAGTDTTYTVIEWAMAELLRHPKAMKKVQDEVRGINGKTKGITEDNLDNMHYLKAVIKEALRFHPPIPFTTKNWSFSNVSTVHRFLPR
jgi:cytochrome P450